MDALDTQTQTGTLKHVRSLQWVTVIKSQQEFDTELEAAKRRLAGDVQTLNLLNEPICERLRNKSRGRGHQLSYVAVRGSATLLHAGHSRKKKEKKEALRFVIFPALCPRSLPPPPVSPTPLSPPPQPPRSLRLTRRWPMFHTTPPHAAGVRGLDGGRRG